MDVGDVYYLFVIAKCSKRKPNFHRHNGGVKSVAASVLQPYRAVLASCLSAVLACVPVGAAELENVDPHDPDFEPGYRFTQAYSEDGLDFSSKGIDLGWAAVNRHGYEIDLSTGLRSMKRYFDDQLFGGWTASMAITAPWPVAPYAELGFDAGEVLGEIIIDRAQKNPKGRNWIDPDYFIGTGLRITLTRRVQLKAYYKLHYVESEHYRALNSGVAGIALVLRFPRHHLEWWQIPL